MRLFCLFLLLVTPLFQVSAIAANRQQFRCSRCGGAIVKCARCGRFQHAGSAHRHPQANLPGNPQVGFNGPQGQFGSPQGQQGQTHFGGQDSRPSNFPDPFRAVAQVDNNPAQVRPVSHEESHREPEHGLENLGQISPRQGVAHQADASGAPRGVNYKATGNSSFPDQVNHCNGFVAGKHDIGNGYCVYPIGTAEHCVKMKRADMKAQTNTGMRDQAFGSEWIGKIEIEGKVYEPLAFSRPDAEMRKSADVAIFAIKGSCADFPDDRVYEVDGSQPQQGENLQFRKSTYWAGIDQTLGYGNRGRAWHAKNIAGKVLSAVAGIKKLVFPGGAFATENEVAIAGGDTIEPGDSGLPVGKNGKVTGILSGYPGNPPFNRFFYSPGAPMMWMKQELEANFGTSVVSTMKDPALLAKH